MLIVTPEEMKHIDRKSIDEFGISGNVLMENAGRGVFDILWKKFYPFHKVCILAGKGNNGGDGFVIARYLANRGIDVKVYLYGDPKEIKGEALYHFELMKMSKVKVYPLSPDDSALKFDLLTCDIIVDAVFGTGFKGELPKDLKLVFSLLKETRGKTVAVDIPSGINGEKGTSEPALPVYHITVTFAYPKLGHLLYPGRKHIGELFVVDIGIPHKYGEEIKRKIIMPYDVYPFLPKREPNVHKGNCGRVMIIGGAKGYGGAISLASEAAYLSGAGLVYAAFPEDIYPAMESKLKETIKIPLPSKDGKLHPKSLSILQEYIPKIDVFAIGPGLLRTENTKTFLFEILDKLRNKKVVLDADAVVLLGEKKEILKEREESLIITPHPGEMAAFIGEKDPYKIDSERIYISEKVATENEILVVLKGAPTIISSLYRTWICPIGNPGMATGGSGDVLTGMIAGLWAQNLPADNAARIGVFLHALAGDIGLKNKNMYSIVASDILYNIPSAINYKFELKAEGIVQKVLPLS